MKWLWLNVFKILEKRKSDNLIGIKSIMWKILEDEETIDAIDETKINF